MAFQNLFLEFLKSIYGGFIMPLKNGSTPEIISENIKTDKIMENQKTSNCNFICAVLMGYSNRG